MPPKRVEKPTRERPPRENLDPEDPDSHKNEPYTCTGKFHKDFAELCHKRGILAPQILSVPQPPVPTLIQHQQQEAKPEKSKKDKNAIKDKEKEKPDAPTQQNEEAEEPKEPEFKTFALRDNIEFGKPTIFVEMENHDKQDTVTEMKIRGFRVDSTMLDIFQQCWAALEKLTVVYFWNVGLNYQTMDQLANALSSCPNIKTLIVEGNPIPEENFYALIEYESSLTNLLLRHNSISDKGAAAIGHALGNPRHSNQKLLVLNLNGNVITDKGFVELVKGLRLNRTLLSLSVGRNFVGDEGMLKLSEVLSMFPLTHEEIVERRRLFGEQRSAERQKSRGESRRDRPNSSTRTTSKEKTFRQSGKKPKDGKGGKDDKDDHAAGKTKGGKKKEDDKEKGATRRGGGGAAEKDKQAEKASKATISTTTTRTKPKDKRGASAESQTPEKMESINPLLDDAEPRNNGELWIPGNRTLIMVNFAYNRITKVGVAALLKALQYQLSMVEFYKNGGSGLLRCNLQHNAIPEDEESFMKLQEHLVNRDPLLRKRPPSVPAATPVNTEPPGSTKPESRAGRKQKDQ